MTLIEVIWDNDEKTILRWDFYPGWTWNDVPAAAKQTQEHLAGIEHEVSIIYNSNKTAIPMDNALQNLRFLMQREPTYRGMTVIANTSGFGIQLVQIIMKVFRVREGKLIFAESVEHAREQLKKNAAQASR
jgi:hypothetical protein